MREQFRGGAFRGQSNKNLRGLIVINFLCVTFLAVCAGIFIFYSPSDKKAEPVASVIIEKEQPMRVVDVIVPLTMIDAGQQLLPTMFRQEPRPEAAVSERSVRDFTEIQGGYARSVIMPGEPLSRDYVTRARPTSIITGNIPEGYRAVTINVDVKTGVEGWVRPGARVDVSWLSGVLGRPSLTIIVQNALVLSAERNINSQVDPGAPIPSTVTLLVTAKDSAKIQLASTTGSISLSLRGERDHGKSDGVGDITIKDLLGSGSTEQGGTDSVEGFARFKRSDGSDEEVVIMNGKLIPKGKEG